jgi:hypothetical protein
MPRKYAKHPDPAKRRAKPITGPVRLAAKQLVWELVAKVYSRQHILAELQKKYGFLQDAAERLYGEVWADITTADQLTLPARRSLLQQQWDALYRAAYDAKQFGVCAVVLSQVKRMYGVDPPTRHQVLPPAASDEVSQRTDAELEYYAERGHWPEEAGKQAPALPPPRDPLEVLTRGEEKVH